jgi:hypothetical protein
MEIKFYKDDKVSYSIIGRHGDYQIHTWGWGTTVNKETNNKEDVYVIKKSVYYGKISQALLYILDCKISDVDKQSILGVINVIKEFKKDVERIKEFKEV